MFCLTWYIKNIIMNHVFHISNVSGLFYILAANQAFRTAIAPSLQNTVYGVTYFLLKSFYLLNSDWDVNVKYNPVFGVVLVENIWWYFSDEK